MLAALDGAPVRAALHYAGSVGGLQIYEDNP
jgi:hypothetical protein